MQVRARHTAGHLIVEVIDTGRGILAEELPLVAGELYRGSNTHDVAGSGLGLAIVQRIIERHGGRLELRSRPGQGTIATVQLPYDQPEPQRPSVSGPGRPGAGRPPRNAQRSCANGST